MITGRTFPIDMEELRLYLEKPITGKRLKCLDLDYGGAGIHFGDGSAFNVYTRVSCNLSVGDDNPVTGCTFSDTRAEIRLGSNSVLEISMDEDDLVGPEFYVFKDTDGTYVVEN